MGSLATPTDENRFPPHVLREYAVLADGERGAVVGPRGDISWMCAPRWHDDPVFSTLIGGPGIYAVTPEDRFVWGGYYESGSLIWVSRWITNSSIIECREALAMPGDPDTAVLLRQVRAIDGPAGVRVTLDARGGFGRNPMSDLRRQDGVWTGRTGRLQFRWSGAPHARQLRDGSVFLAVELEPGARHDLVLEISRRKLSGPAPNPEMAWSATEATWAERVPDLSHSVGRRDARHAYAILTGLTSESGGSVAAMTMGLPERATRGRSYDYRYAWVRDQSFAGQAAVACGEYRLLDDAVRFISARLLDDGPQLKPAYRVDGGPVPAEAPIRELGGYPGGSARKGNRVNRQFQLDTLGEALLVLAAAGKIDRLDNQHWKAVETAVSAIDLRWRDVDAGIWEIDNQRWAHSRLTCVAGLKAAAAIAPSTQGAEWSNLADHILADVGSDCVHPSGRWQRSPGDPRVDASLLLPAIRGALPADDPRSLATVGAVIRELNRDGFVYRYRHNDEPLENAEGAFLLCGFLLALSANQLGRTSEAVAWFERNRTGCGPSGLFTEEFDVVQRQLRGNLPQAFVHALMLECSCELAKAVPELVAEENRW